MVEVPGFFGIVELSVASTNRYIKPDIAFEQPDQFFDFYRSLRGLITFCRHLVLLCTLGPLSPNVHRKARRLLAGRSAATASQQAIGLVRLGNFIVHRSGQLSVVPFFRHFSVFPHNASAQPREARASVGAPCWA